MLSWDGVVVAQQVHRLLATKVRDDLGQNDAEAVEDQKQKHQGPHQRAGGADDGEDQRSQGAHISQELHHPHTPQCPSKAEETHVAHLSQQTWSPQLNQGFNRG